MKMTAKNLKTNLEVFKIRQSKRQAKQWLRFGDVRPAGWIKALMQHDLEEGFTGHLDELVPDLLLNDDIYGANRLTGAIRNKDLGVIKQDADWEVMYLWWNSETQGNWWDGLVRSALLLDQNRFLEKATSIVEKILSTQDADGYLGIYAPDLRFKFSNENGELWAQAVLFRMLLGYFEATGEERALSAVKRAVQVTMNAYPIHRSQPFTVKDSFAGVCHGLAFTDVLDRLHQLTGDFSYLEYAAWLYQEYSTNTLSQDDIQYHRLVDPGFRFQKHGVHTYEHLRSLLTALYATGNESLENALEGYLAKLESCLTPSGGPIGDEFIGGREADASETGYEYCSIQELLDSYTHLLQKTGRPGWADKTEWLLFNAGLGARHPQCSAIAYLKTDTSSSMTGPLHLDSPPEQAPQTRYKYSPVHQDVAVCCVPNAGRIFPYYVKAMWMHTENGLAATLYGPSELRTVLKDIRVNIREETRYPYDLAIDFFVEPEQPVTFDLQLRLPAWANGFKITGTSDYSLTAGTIHIDRSWQSGDHIHLCFEADIKTHSWHDAEVYFSHGPLLYTRPLQSRSRPGRRYPKLGFQDEYVEASPEYIPTSLDRGTTFTLEQSSYDHQRPWESLALINNAPDSPLRLVPIGGTILRQVTFPIKDQEDAIR